MILLILFFIGIILYMAKASRMCGGGEPKLSLGLDQWLYAVPYGLVSLLAGWWAIPAYLLAVVGKRLGHGRGFNYTLPMEPGSEPERVEVLIPDRLPLPYYKAAIMALTGVAVPLAPAIVCAVYGHWMAGAALIASGLAKAAAYALPKTEWAEYATGAFAGAGIVTAVLFMAS